MLPNDCELSIFSFAMLSDSLVQRLQTYKAEKAQKVVTTTKQHTSLRPVPGNRNIRRDTVAVDGRKNENRRKTLAVSR